MSGCIAECVDAAHLRVARGLARSRLLVTVVAVRAVIVCGALRCSRFDDTIAKRRQFVSMFDWTHASAALVDDEATLQRAHTASGFVDFVAIFHATRLAFAVDIQRGARWTHAIAIYVSNVAFVDATQRC